VCRAYCVPRNTVQPLLDFVQLCERLTPCAGSVISTPGPYYVTKNQSVPGFAVCLTCFEMFLRHTAFEGRFEVVPDGTYAGTQQWTCDLAMPFYQRLVKADLGSATPDFAHFVEEASTRMPIPECPGPGKAIAQFGDAVPGLIFTAKGGKTGNICFAC
jgi:hypothetical protein